MAPSRYPKLSLMREGEGPSNRRVITVCGICSKPISNSDLVYTHSTCDQRLHKVCYENWRESLRKRQEPSTCPVCQQRIDRHIYRKESRETTWEDDAFTGTTINTSRSEELEPELDNVISDDMGSARVGRPSPAVERDGDDPH